MHLLLALLLSVSAHSFASQEFIPEASALTKVGTDFIIAGDEEPKSFWLSTDGVAVEKVKVKGAGWDDMEGMATVSSEQFFGITSHSLTKKGKQKPEREQLILFEKNEKKITALKSWSLRKQALALLAKNLGDKLDMNVVSTASPDHGGFNIEGMAFVNGSLYLGLRSPVTSSGEAIILVVENAETNPQVSKTITIATNGKGIRSLDSFQRALLVLSGSSDDTDSAFSLGRLDTFSRELKELSVAGFEKLLRPEGMASSTDGSIVFVQDFQEESAQDVIVRLELR